MVKAFAQPFSSRFCMFCAYSRPKYQVSVYRTIVPLVAIFYTFNYTLSICIALFVAKKMFEKHFVAQIC